MAVSVPQRDTELQRDLHQLTEIFEENLRRYVGNDPIEHWYDYILKTEEVDLKYSNSTNNLIPILERCLSTFETNEKYINDRRLCKLWIKYIDLQPNQIELYQLLYSKGICRQCADLYCAWALYHEIGGNFKQANNVFEMGMWVFAQPYEELAIAHKNMVFTAGLQMIHGNDDRRVNEMKQVLASLHRNPLHQQTIFYSTRQSSANEYHPSLPFLANPLFRAPPVEPQSLSNNSIPQGGVLDAIRSRDSVASRSSTSMRLVEPQPVIQPNGPDGIRIYPDFSSTNHDNFDTWHVDLCVPEEVMPNSRPMYPKQLVYTNGTEVSLEEIRSGRYLAKMKVNKNNNAERMSEDMFSQESSGMSNDSVPKNESVKITQPPEQQYMSGEYYSQPTATPTSASSQQSFPNYEQQVESYQNSPNYPQNYQNPGLVYEQNQAQNYQPSGEASSVQNKIHLMVRSDSQPQNYMQNARRDVSKEKNDVSMQEMIPNAAAIWQNTSTTEESTMSDLWKGSFREPPKVDVKKPLTEMFQIHEDTKLLNEETRSLPQENVHRSFSSQPIHREFNEENVRHQPFSQPTEINRPPLGLRTPLGQPFAENARFLSPTTVQKAADIFQDRSPQNFEDDSCANTQMFYSNLRHVSTPYNPKKLVAQQYSKEVKTDDLKCNRQKLFVEHEQEDVAQQNIQQEKLSVIYETTKEFCSSSGSSAGSSAGTMLKTFNAHSLKTIAENTSLKTSPINTFQQMSYNENKNLEHHSYVQNMDSSNMHRSTTREIPEDSYRLNVRNDHILGIHERTQSPHMSAVSYNMTVQNFSIPNNHTQLNYSLQPVKHPNASLKLPPFPNEPSCIIIDDENAPNENTNNLMRLSEIAEQHSQMHRQPIKDAPLKDGMFYDGSNDSNSIKDVWGRSSAKGSRMDIDVGSQHSNNSELKMDFDSCHEPPVKDDLILLKTPSDPFSSKLIETLLKKVGFPNQLHRKNYIFLRTLPRLVRKEVHAFGDEKFLIGNIIGKGNYGSVFKATNVNTNEAVALKLQKPPNQWEFYICNEIQYRIVNPHLLNAFMSVQAGYFSPIASVLISEFCKHGSLLDISNKVKQVTGKGIKELCVIYFANEIMTIVNALHQCQVIHADIKPDNFLVTRMPPEFGRPCLQLIDFGCSIDMSLFPKGTQFKKVINTENFICAEMKDGRPWTYQTDLFCISATVHALLFEKYMQIQKRNSVWTIQTHIPRYLRTDLWNTFFFQFLNIESSDKLPDLNSIKHSFQTIISECSEELQIDMRYVANCVIGR